MERVALFVDDPADAKRAIDTLLARPQAPGFWIIVLCAPKLTHRIGPWAANRSRERWRERWAAGVRGRLEAAFERAAGAKVLWTLARGPLQDLTRDLRLQHDATLEVVDARRSRAEADPSGAPGGEGGRLRGLGALSAGMTLLLAMAD